MRCLFLFVVAVLTACSSPVTPPITVETPLQTALPLPKSKPTNTVVPTATGIPGFEDWSVLNPPAIDIHSEEDSLLVTLKGSVLWFMNRRGELIYKMVSGDFKITADVHTAKSSDPNQPPGGDGTVQLGGLMARNGKGGQENYVFIVVGDDGDGLSVETKDTLESFSKYNGPAWDSPDAELRICRIGQAFNLYKRHVDSSESWQLADTFERPDLPDELQVGVNIYTDAQPDLQIRYEKIRIEPVSSAADCETD
jgi:hypothetical protein